MTPVGSLYVGFTGTRNGMTASQLGAVARVVAELAQRFALVAAHGDCVGADADFHSIAQQFGAYIVGHPPTDSSLRAWCDFDQMRQPLAYIRRNKNIVTESNVMIAAPPTDDILFRGGTWTTIHEAIRQGRPMAVCLPTQGVRYTGDWPI